MPPNSRLYNFVGLVTYSGYKPYRIIGTVYGVDEIDAEANIINAFLEKPTEFKLIELKPRPENLIVSMITTADE